MRFSRVKHLRTFYMSSLHKDRQALQAIAASKKKIWNNSIQCILVESSEAIMDDNAVYHNCAMKEYKPSLMKKGKES